MAYPNSMSDSDLQTLWTRSRRLIHLIPRITLMFTVIQVGIFPVPVTTTFVDNTVSCAADTFPTNTHFTDAPVLSVEAINDDDDLAQHAHPCCDCHPHSPPHKRLHIYRRLLTRLRPYSTPRTRPAPSNVEDRANALHILATHPNEGRSAAASDCKPQRTHRCWNVTLDLKGTPLPPRTTMMEGGKEQ